MADTKWDAANIDSISFATPRGDKWEGEDEDDDIKDNWDDEDEEPAAIEPKKEAEDESGKAIQVKRKNIVKNKLKEKEERITKEGEKMLNAYTSEDVVRDKIDDDELEEESDFELSKETLGISDTKNNIDAMELSSKEDFENYKKSLVNKLSKHETSIHYLTFLEDLFRDLCINLEADDVKKFGTTLNALSNEKVKAAKATKSKKKGTQKKASLVVGKASDMDLDAYAGGEEFDDFI